MYAIFYIENIYSGYFKSQFSPILVILYGVIKAPKYDVSFDQLFAVYSTDLLALSRQYLPLRATKTYVLITSLVS